ncbi:cyclic nucleotide-binding domain-containing protein [Ferrovibrio sp.]|uniref:Crp/Fnr family transcriptional regulator n=1 Tax=Ferrovibrio sp. TaxID=1917215 RepID=UPI0025C5406E|nr:cyclic nucleotide-binding domain-containing protein [Ferrovibrio sp.]MBX3455602.1 cyclic nucleotide-binding domain-containing protein [Ferrovibrio sp.]
MTVIAIADRRPNQTASKAASAVDPCTGCTVGKLSLCDALDAEGRKRFKPMVRGQALEPHQMLFQEGDAAEHVYTVTSGQVSLARSLPDGRRQIVDFAGPGDFLGLSLGLEEPVTHRLSAEALTQSRVCRLPRAAFNRLMQDEPALSRRALEFAARRIRASQEQQLSLGRKTAAERVASFLVDMAERNLARGGNASPLSLPMTRADIADHLGLTLETVSRAFSRLRKLGLIKLEGADRVAIPNLDALSGETAQSA